MRIKNCNSVVQKGLEGRAKVPLIFFYENLGIYFFPDMNFDFMNFQQQSDHHSIY